MDKHPTVIHHRETKPDSSMKKIKMLTKANFRLPTRLLETIQSYGHNPLRTGIAVTTQGSLEDKTFKAMTTEDKETVNSGLFLFCSVHLGFVPFAYLPSFSH